MRRSPALLVALLGLALAPAPAQTINSVRVFADAPGALINVDGNIYLNSAEFLWPSGSKHTVTFHEPDPSLGGTYLQYLGWITNLSPSAEPSTSQPITASPGLQWIQLKFKVFFPLSIVLPDCGAQPCPYAGRVQVVKPAGCIGIYARSFTCLIEKNVDVDVRALPDAGAVFTEWRSATGLPAGNAPTSFTLTFPMSRPLTLNAQFAPAASVNTTVSLRVDPQELKIIVDGTRFTPPLTVEWGWNSVHTVGADPVQTARGTDYAFDSWSDGGPINHEVRVPSPSGPIELVARFVPAHTVRFQTSPPNLMVKVDGQDWSNYQVAWAPGSTHAISAPATQNDPQGRRYRFVSWSNGKPASFEYIAGAAGPGPTLVATYQLLGQATIASTPSNLQVQVDGTPCTTPCRIERDAGATVTIAAAPVISGGERSRLVFRGWSDTQAASRAIQLAGEARTYTAAYVVQNRVDLTVSPADGASLVVDPRSPDDFYDDGAQVAVSATLALGFRVRSWTGDLLGTTIRTVLTVDAPKSAVLTLDRVPAIAPFGIRNAAGSLPDDVAPGSLVSIFGANLAPALEVGPSNPLAQSLQGVTALLDDNFLPLVFVSPGQINAQLPSGLEPGPRRLSIRWAGKEAAATVNVVRNAPGLFSAGGDDGLGVFLRLGGGAINGDRPARAGDVVDVLGTGLGAYTAPPPAGFILDESAGYRAADPVSVVVGETSLEALYAGRSGAGAGVDFVRFRLPDRLPDTPFVKIRIVVNGRESNTVQLPIQP